MLKRTSILFATIVGGQVLAAGATMAEIEPSQGAVFVGTNHNNTQALPGQPANQVVMFHRAADGSLRQAGVFDTGGQGSGPAVQIAGNSLGSAHSIQLADNGRFLLVANAGSDSVSVFRVLRDALVLTDVTPSGGTFPNSIAVAGSLVYVLNAAGAGTLAGFQLTMRGELVPIAGSRRSIDADQDPVHPDSMTAPAQVSFTPNGRQLVVTMKGDPEPLSPDVGPGRVLVFDIDRDGRPSATYAQTEFPRQGPFGFTFDRHGHLVITFAFATGDAPRVGSFSILTDGSLDPIPAGDPPPGDPPPDDPPPDDPPPNPPTGPTCWLESNGETVFGSSYGTGLIAAYRLGRAGSTTLLDGRAGSTNDLPGTIDDPAGADGKSQGSTPLDLGIDRAGHFLYSVLPGSGAVAAWRIDRRGTLIKIGEYPIVVPGLGVLATEDGDRAPFDFGPGASPAGIAVR